MSTPEPATECDSPVAIYRIEGYSPRDGRLHGSLDVALYACAEHEPRAREVVSASALAPYTCQTIGTGHTMRCGDSWRYEVPEPSGRWER